jgi:hypothetical protein
MPIDDYENYVFNEAKKPQQESTSALAGEALRAAAWTAVQMPIEGTTQMVSKAVGKDIQAMQLIDAPKPAESGSMTWMAQRIGVGAGGSLLTAGLHAGIGTRFSGSASTVGKEMLHAGTTGAVLMGVLTPTDTSGNFWEDRAVRAATGGALFAGGAAFTAGVRAGATRFAEGSFLRRAYTDQNMYVTCAKVTGAITTAVSFDDILKSTKKN